jgi:integration host factor subunit alpha
MQEIKPPGMPPTASGQAVTVSRVHLAESLCLEIGLTQKDAATLVDAVLEEISIALIRGDSVKLTAFGTFSVRRKNRRMGRNPLTGKEVPISARKVSAFRASHILKAHINHASRVGHI